MKLFVWVDPYPVAYGSSLVFAVADTVEKARDIARNAPGYRFGEFEIPTPHVTLEEPTRVIDIEDGVGEWHHWEE